MSCLTGHKMTYKLFDISSCEQYSRFPFNFFVLCLRWRVVNSPGYIRWYKSTTQSFQRTEEVCRPSKRNDYLWHSVLPQVFCLSAAKRTYRSICMLIPWRKGIDYVIWYLNAPMRVSIYREKHGIAASLPSQSVGRFYLMHFL